MPGGWDRGKPGWKADMSFWTETGEFGDKEIQGSCKKLQDMPVSDLNVDFPPFFCHVARLSLLVH